MVFSIYLGSLNMKHGQTINYKITPTYHTWKAMKSRCYYVKNDHYYVYGAKGIIVCDEWKNSFNNFLKDMGERPKNCTLDRIDNSKNYCKENCQWADKYQQARNHSKVINFTIENVTKTLAEWSDHFGLKYSTVYGRYRKNWPINLIFSKKSYLNKNHYNELLSSSR